MFDFRMLQSRFCLITVFVVIFTSVCWSCESSRADSPTYKAAVVEYHKIRRPLDPEEEASRNLKNYVELINEAADVDIIVFPESTLNNYKTGEFFDVDTSITPCETKTFGNIISTISCAARDTQKYVSINLVETSICPDQQQIELNDTRPCPDDKINKYNTNVVFDRNGRIVSKYRKFNLYGEKEVTHPLYPQAVSFTTDFGVTFGHFICFDILFYEPTMTLINQGVTDIIFPSMWFSKAPFLTAGQIQQAWAYANNVNLLAAGASDPTVGSTGTGIYHGRKGSLVSVMSHTSRSKIYTAVVPKINVNHTTEPNVQPPERSTPEDMLKLFLKKDNTLPFNTHRLEKQGQTQMKLCHGVFCCYFDVDIEFLGVNSTSNLTYEYRLITYDGLRTYQREAVQICAILACSGTQLETCGLRYNSKNVNYDSVLFKNVTIQANIQWKNILVMPSSLDFSILPYNVNDIGLVTNRKKYNTHAKMELLTSKSDIYSFGLYIRNYEADR